MSTSAASRSIMTEVNAVLKDLSLHAVALCDDMKDWKINVYGNSSDDNEIFDNVELKVKEANELTARIPSLTEKLKQIESQAELCETEMGNKRQELEVLTANVEEAKAKFDRLGQENDRLSGENQDLLRDTANIRGRVANIVLLEAKRPDLELRENKVREEQIRVEQLSQDLQEREHTLEGLETAAAEIHQSLDEQRQAIQSDHGRASGWTDSLMSWQGNLLSRESSLLNGQTSLETDRETIRAERARLNDQASRQSNVALQQAAAAQTNRQAEAQVERNAQFVRRCLIDVLQVTGVQASVTLDDLNQLGPDDTLHPRISEYLSIVRQEIRTLRDQNRDLSTQVQTLQGNKSVLELQRHQSDGQRHSRISADIQANFQRLEDTMSKLKQDGQSFAALQEKLKEKDQQILRLLDGAARHQEEVNEARNSSRLDAAQSSEQECTTCSSTQGLKDQIKLLNAQLSEHNGYKLQASQNLVKYTEISAELSDLRKSRMQEIEVDRANFNAEEASTRSALNKAQESERKHVDAYKKMAVQFGELRNKVESLETREQELKDNIKAFEHKRRKYNQFAGLMLSTVNKDGKGGGESSK